jgi:hypothetical protein
MANFKKELKALINSYSKENESNTPDFILAEYMINCLHAFEKATNERTKFIVGTVENIENVALPIRALTKKMKEAREYVDKYMKLYGTKPTYRKVAESLGIKSTAAYSRLRGYRHMMMRRQ